MSAPLLRGVDRAAFTAALVARLRRAGVAVGLTAAEDLARALAAAPPDTRSQLYWVARVTLVRRQEELEAFDAVFQAVFADALLPFGHASRGPRSDQGPDGEDALAPVPRGRPDAGGGDGLPWVTLPAVVATSDDSDSALSVPTRLPSALEGLADQPFEQLADDEIDLLGRWLEEGLRSWPARRTRRRRAARSGHQVALRATIARSRRTGWDPVELVHVRPVLKPRRVVMLCDVSQSMQAQAMPYFHLMRLLTRRLDGEGFAFATTLTRLTPLLRHRSAAVAVEQATEQVTDRFGGTRIAAAVNALLASHHGSAVRGGVVVIASDGWDSEPPQDLAVAMARLRRRAHRLVWVNPRAGAPGFAPLVGTMAAALPFCDDLLPAHDFRSLAAVVAELGRSTAVARGPVLSSTG